MTSVLSETLAPVDVVFSYHAQKRLRERFPHLAEPDVAELLLDAVDHGRWSGRIPEWAARGWRGQKQKGACRFAWNPEETIAIVYARRRNRDTKQSELLVVTVLGRLDEEQLGWAAEWRRAVRPLVRRGR